MAIKIGIRLIALAIAVCSLAPMGADAASGPKYAVHHLAEPAVSPDMGRIYFYRVSGLLGFGLQPSIEIDGVKVGKSVTSRYFYVDRPPGTYTISTTTEKEETASVPLAAGQTVYVRFDVSMGFLLGHVSPLVVDSAMAADEIKDCHFVEADAPPAATTTAAPGSGSASGPVTATSATSPAPAATATAPPTDPATTTASPPAAPATAQPAQTTPQK